MSDAPKFGNYEFVQRDNGVIGDNGNTHATPKGRY
jgi:hypothetical protein